MRASLITGNTFPVRGRLAALGGAWVASRGGWLFIDPAAAAQARRIVREVTRGGYGRDREPLWRRLMVGRTDENVVQERA